MGSNPVERSQVDQWISFGNASCYADMLTVCYGIFGWFEVTQGDWNEANKNIKSNFKIINTHLEGKKWLVGEEMTIADVYLAIVLSNLLQTTLDAGFRKAMKNASDWAERVFSNPSVIKILGTQ